MTVSERLRRVPPLGWAITFAVLMTLPGLWSFGFWDPWELGLADHAKELARVGKLLDPTAGGRYTAEPPLDLFLSGLGMRIFGPNEMGARFFNALFGIGALLAVYWGGLGLFRRRAALLSTLALGTMPLFILQARQLTSDMPLVAGLALALGGLGRYAWPEAGRRRTRDLLLAVLGFVIGILSGGALLGFALPCLAITGAIVAAWSVVPRSKETGGRALLAAVGAAGLVVLITTLTTANVAGKFSLLLGGIPRGGTPPQMFEFLIRQIGFGVFPWSALVVFALGRALVRLGDEAADAPSARRAFAELHLLLFAAFGFGLDTIYVLMTGDARFPVLAPLALAVGAFLDEALDGEHPEPVLGLLVATGTLVVARDFFLAPEELVSVHLLAKVKWPPALSIGYGFLAVGGVVGAGIYAGLATRGRALGRVPSRDLGNAKPWRRRLEQVVVRVGSWGIHAAVGGAVLFSVLVVHALVPTLSRHFSFKPVLESYTQFAKEGEEIGKYHIEGHGTGFYSSRKMVEILSQDKLVEFLKQPKRAFCLVAADDLAPLDAAFKLAQLSYFVVDASSSRFLLLSNRLLAGEEERNPLKKNVWMAPRPPEPVTAAGTTETRYEWNGQVPPWGEPKVRASAVFANSIELLGADFPPSIRRPGKIPLKIHFRVLTRPPAGYKIFAHFDAPGEPRLNGDHAPLDGAFPTAYWLPGEYILDEVEVDVPLMTTPAGTYTVLVGFWPGGEQKRLAITAGNSNDGVDRARVGVIEIR